MYSKVSPNLFEKPAPVATQATEEAKRMGKQILDQAEQVAKERDISVEKVLREGDAIKEIVTVAKEGRFDLIVVGHRGMSKFKELLLGAVSEGVSHEAPCTVTIVKWSLPDLFCFPK